jgi:hypothetical protein
MHTGGRSEQGKADQKKKQQHEEANTRGLWMEKGNQIRKRNKGEEKRNVPRSRKGTTTGPAEASTDGNGGNDGAHEQDANPKSRAEGGEAASWRSNRIEKAREATTGAAV